MVGVKRDPLVEMGRLPMRGILNTMFNENDGLIVSV